MARLAARFVDQDFGAIGTVVGKEGDVVRLQLRGGSIAGADLSRVVISHLDEQPDTAYHRAILERGVYVEYDTFGSESYFDGDGSAEPSDRERVDCLIELLDAGFGDRLLISQDVCTKVQLLKFGGSGYGHILRSIVPRLRRRGVDDATVLKLLVENPARVLATAS